MNEQRCSLEKYPVIHIISIHTFCNIYINKGLEYL